MVLESLLTPLEAENRLKRVFVFGFLYTIIGAFLALWIFKESASLVMVFLTVVATLPLIYLTLKFEEENDLKIENERILIREHGKALKVFMYLFFGMILGYSLLFIILFAFFYGAGTIFILTWNASVIGAAVGNFVRSRVLDFADYFYIIPLGIMRYMTHGFFEILAYFIGGLAGGIISVAVINHNVDSDKFVHILKDSIDLFLLAIIMLVFA